MTEDAKVFEDGPVFEPTKRLRGLAAVEEFAAMSENEEGVSSRGSLNSGRSSNRPQTWVKNLSSTRLDYLRTPRTRGVVPENERLAPILKFLTKKSGTAAIAASCVSNSRLGDTWPARVVTLAEPEATTTRGPARPYTRSQHPQAASATNLLCPSRGRIDGSNPGAGRRSLVTSAKIAITPRRSECSCCSSERHRSPHGYPDTSLLVAA